SSGTGMTGFLSTWRRYSAMWILLGPAALARYIASSALRKSSSLLCAWSGKPAIPMLAVRRASIPCSLRKMWEVMDSWSRSAAACLPIQRLFQKPGVVELRQLVGAPEASRLLLQTRPLQRDRSLFGQMGEETLVQAVEGLADLVHHFQHRGGMLPDEDRHAENGPRDETGRPVDIGEETPVRASVVDHGGLPALGDPPDDALPGFDAKPFEPSGLGAADHVEDQLVGGRIDQEQRPGFAPDEGLALIEDHAQD